MKVRWKLAILLLSITIMTGCSDATEETPTAATITPTAVATVPPSPVPEASPSLVMPSATPTPTAHATGGAFVSVLPTPTWTPTPTPSPTPWPTLTPLPAVPAATPELASLPDFGIAWIRPAGNWSNYRGRQLNPTVLQQDWLLITSTGWRQPVDALSISDGTTVWRYPADLEPGSPDIEIRSIAARDDILAVQAMKKLVVLTPTSGTPGWSVDLQDRVDLAGASDGQLYLFDYSVYPAQLVALDARTSQERWRYDCTFSSPVLATDEWLFVTCEDLSKSPGDCSNRCRNRHPHAFTTCSKPDVGHIGLSGRRTVTRHGSLRPIAVRHAIEPRLPGYSAGLGSRTASLAGIYERGERCQVRRR